MRLRPRSAARTGPRASYRAVVLAGGLAALAVAAVLLTLGLLQRQAHRDRVQDHTVLMARVFAEHATRSIDAAALAATTLNEQLARSGVTDAPELRAALAQTLVNLPYLRGIGILDAQGRVIGSADPGDLGLQIDLAPLGPLPAPGDVTLGPFVAARRLADLQLGALQPSAVGFLPLLSVVQRSPQETLIVLLQINADALANFQQTTLDDERMAAGLLGWNGGLLAATQAVSHATGASLATLPAFTRFLPAREHGSWQGEGLRGGEQLAAFRVSRRWPVLAMVEFDAATERASWWQDSRGGFAVGGAVLLFIGVMTGLAARSVRARDRARAQVEQREREMSTILQGLQELVFRCDGDGTLQYVNPAWVTLTGQPAEHWTGRPLADCVQDQNRYAVRQLLAPGGGTRQARLVLPDAQGRPRQFECSMLPMTGQGGGFVGSAVDITARVEAQRRLQAQLAFTEMLLESSPLPMSVMSRDRHYQIVNRAWEGFTGKARADVIGRAVGAHLPAAERAQHEAADDRVYATREPVRYDAQVAHADGSLRDVVVEKRALPGDDGQAVGILAVIIDVTEFRAAERATREARDAAEEASRAKSEFIANISHELRTPLQSIIGFSELGLRRMGDPTRLAAMFGDIHASGHRMLALVNDLLDVARIESSVGTIHLERADLRPLVREVLRELQPQASERRLNLQDTLPDTPMSARVDPARFQQVVRNVLANAIRFSPAGGQVDVTAHGSDTGTWQLQIADRGPGIPETELETIFEAFVQSSRTKDGSGGTGLGLAICRTILQAHGGQIRALNRPGGGSVFEIELPMRGSGETAPAPLPSSNG